MMERTMADTALSAGFRRVGIIPRDVALNLALSQFRNNGGTYERALKLLRDAFGMPSEAGQPAPKGQSSYASSRQQNGDGGGQTDRADNGQRSLASPSPANRDGAGQLPIADKGHGSSARPAREPSRIERAAMRGVRQGAAVVTLTVLDTWRLRNGRAIGDLTYGELEGMRFENAREAYIIRQIQGHVANATSDQKVRDLISVEVLQRFIQRAAEAADVA